MARLAAAPDGAVVRIQPGHYKGTVAVTKAVSLIPAGEAGSVWFDADEGPALFVTNGTCRASGLRLTSRHRAADANERFHPGAVVVEQGVLELEECLIQGSANGIVVSRSQGQLTAADCRIAQVGRFAVHVHHGGQAQLSRMEFATERASAVVIEGPDTRVRVIDCEVERSGGHGIEILDASPAIERCTVRATAMSGIAVSGSRSAPTVIENTVGDSLGHGIQVIGGAGGRYYRNSLNSLGGHGVAVGQRGSHPELLENNVSRARVGISFADGAGGSAVRNAIAQCDVSILVSGAGTVPTLQGNHQDAPTLVDPSAVDYAGRF
jgi:hypothetical protein